MKTNHWHHTVKGPQKCKGNLRGCAEAKRFSSSEAVLDYDERLKKQAAWDKKIAGLQQRLINPGENRLFVSVLSGSRIGGMRQFGDTMDRLFHGPGVTPSLFHGQWYTSVHNGSYRPVKITVSRANNVDIKRGLITGTWEVAVTTTLKDQFDFTKVNETTKLDLSNPEVTEDEFARLRDVFRQALALSGVNVFTDKKNRMGPKLDELMTSFLSMFNAVESEEMGESALADMRLGYFQGRILNEIRADEEYAFSAFRGINFERYLTGDEHFKTMMPRIDLRITDQREQSDAYWSLYYSDGHWGVQFAKQNGETGDYVVADAQGAYDAVHYHVIRENNPGDEKEADKKATFAYEFVWDVNKAMAAHRSKIEPAVEPEVEPSNDILDAIRKDWW